MNPLTDDNFLLTVTPHVGSRCLFYLGVFGLTDGVSNVLLQGDPEAMDYES